MRTINVKSVVVWAVLAGAAVSAGAKVSAQEEGGLAPALVAQVQDAIRQADLNFFGGGQPLKREPASQSRTPLPVSQSAVATPERSSAPEQERANMGMMILVGLGMVGTLMVKSRRP